MLRTHGKWLIPIMLMILLTPFSSWIDQIVSNYFYTSGEGFSENPFFRFLYLYGIIPGWVVAIGAMIALTMSYLSEKFLPWRKHALLLVLTLAIGSGIITHAFFKDHWGRPRPRQTVEYGGTQEFRPFYKPNFFHQPEPSKSFSCGHCTMGFYFFAVALLGRRLKKPSVEMGGYLLALLIGVSLSLARIEQGGHFVTDTLMSALIMWLTALTLEWVIYERTP